jgi:hypothetical protein
MHTNFSTFLKVAQIMIKPPDSMEYHPCDLIFAQMEGISIRSSNPPG